MSASIFWLAAVFSLAQDREYEANIPARHPEIQYWEQEGALADPVSRLARDIERGARELRYADDGTSYLSSLLDALGIRSDSQVLVFSKTSLQRSMISPEAPRAIYFGDDVAVGFVPGGEAIELASYDPRQGGVFYTLSAAPSDAPRFERPPICLSCHHDVATLGVPGMYVGSVMTSESGRPRFLGSVVSDHRTAFDERWGGWFVDGTTGAPHRGNAAASGPQNSGLASLLRRYDPGAYLEPTSDVVALMVLEHQTQMANYLVRLSWESRIGAGPTNDRLEEVARYMTFMDEAPFEAPFSGASRFTETFPIPGPRDSSGRSLRDLDLTERLFRYPLSYMIHGEAFAALPADVRDALYHRLFEKLTSYPGAAKAAAADAIEILRATSSDLPADWGRASTPTGGR